VKVLGTIQRCEPRLPAAERLRTLAALPLRTAKRLVATCGSRLKRPFAVTSVWTSSSTSVANRQDKENRTIQGTIRAEMPARKRQGASKEEGGSATSLRFFGRLVIRTLSSRPPLVRASPPSCRTRGFGFAWKDLNHFDVRLRSTGTRSSAIKYYGPVLL
jgi:hypothetical protein